MTTAVPDILARIAATKRAELAGRRQLQPEFARLASENRTAHRDFESALRAAVPAIIAEAKQASPSRGLLSTRGAFDPAAIARAYESGGAAAISVLTDAPYFQGSLEDLAASRAAVTVPVLRKDFTLEAFHVVEAAAFDADAILLIAALLPSRELRDLRELAESLGMAALVEVHDGSELDSAIGSGARIIGVNNRDLRTFEVRLETSLSLAERIPAGVIAVSESGIRSRADVARLEDAGYRAFLVGEYLMKSGDPAAAIRELRQRA
jgi:indole-3-glycerol phosphate synthase